MKIRLAELDDLIILVEIVHQTIKQIFPRYYPMGAVDSFLDYHSESTILDDIKSQNIYVLDVGGAPVGTITIKENMMNRLFVLPEYQGKGYGEALFVFSEQLIFEKYKKIRLEASLPAKIFYLKHGYKEVESHAMLVENGDYLFYDVMEKDYE